MSRTERTKRIRALAVLLTLVFATVAGVYAYQRIASGSPLASTPGGSCSAPLGKAKVLRTQLRPPTNIGGVTEYALPAPLRAPNAPVVAPDGSVWFGEQSVAGVAHFYPGNRTLVEYAWPYSYHTPPNTDNICGNKSDIWGVALWDGKVWASDTSGNQLVALDPSTGGFSTVKLPAAGSYPYTMTIGPHGSLWFPELFSSKIAELLSNGTLRQFALPRGQNAAPTQVIFANSTEGFYDDVGQAGSHNGGVYSFNLDHFDPVLLGNTTLEEPSSIALASGALWVALHGSSSVGSFNLTTKSWSFLPTSYVYWGQSTITTLPYFVESNGSNVWLTEHYGNRMATIDPSSRSMVEYSESDHPITGSTIVSALTLALGGGKTWFTEWTANGIGYVDAGYDPGFSTSLATNSSTIDMKAGSSASVELKVHDTTYKGPLNLTFADSEGLTSKPVDLTFSVPSTTLTVPQGGVVPVTVNVTAAESLNPGTYWAALTATDGTTFESCFLEVQVT